MTQNVRLLLLVLPQIFMTLCWCSIFVVFSNIFHKLSWISWMTMAQTDLDILKIHVPNKSMWTMCLFWNHKLCLGKGESVTVKLQEYHKLGVLNLWPTGQIEPWNTACRAPHRSENLVAGEQWQLMPLRSLLPKSQALWDRSEPGHILLLLLGQVRAGPYLSCHRAGPCPLPCMATSKLGHDPPEMGYISSLSPLPFRARPCPLCLCGWRWGPTVHALGAGLVRWRDPAHGGTGYCSFSPVDKKVGNYCHKAI